MGKLNFQHHYSSVTWSFRNHCNVIFYCSRNISYYYQYWKQLCCYFCGKYDFFFYSLINAKFSIKIFYNNVLTVTFGQFNALLPKKNINYFTMKNSPNLWIVVCFSLFQLNVHKVFYKFKVSQS